MVTLRNDKHIDTSAAPAAGNSAPQKRKAPTVEKEPSAVDTQKSTIKPKKIKHEDDLIEGNPNTCPLAQTKRTATSPPADDTQQNPPRTPGRIGPIKPKCHCEPDIKPFKGEPGHKIRKSFAEKEKEYKDFILNHEGHAFHELHVCYAKGPNGSPTYDKAGFELDYEKVAQWMKPVTRQQIKRSIPKQEKYFEKKREEDRRKFEIFLGGSLKRRGWMSW